MKRLNKAVCAVLVLLIAVFAGGCSSSLKVAKAEYTASEYLYTVELSVSAAVDSTLKSKDGKRTLSSYLNALSTECGINAEITRTVYSENVVYTAIFYNTPSYISAPDEGYSVKTEKGLFFTTYTVTMKNPLDELASVYKNGTAVADKSNAKYVAYVIANGTSEIPAFHEYFSLEKQKGENLALTYLLQSRMLMDSNAEVKEILYNTDYFAWESTLTAEGGQIVYSKKSPNSYVWYATFIVVGLVVSGIILLVTLKSKKSPELVDETVLEQQRLAFKKASKTGARVVPVAPPKSHGADIYGDDIQIKGNTNDEDVEPKSVESNADDECDGEDQKE